MPERELGAASCHAFEERLPALLDDELPPAEQEQVTAHLYRCTACAALLAQEKLARRALRSLATELQAPPDLRARVTWALNRKEAHSFRRRRLSIFAGLAAVLAVIAAVALLRLQQPATSSAALARALNVQATETLGIEPVSFQSSDARAVAAWAHAQTGHAIEVPSLTAQGYDLLGVRLEPSLAAGAVSLIYAGPAGRVTCAILPKVAPLGANDAGRGFHLAQSNGAAVAAWHESGTTYLLVGMLPPATLLQLAHLAAKQ